MLAKFLLQHNKADPLTVGGQKLRFPPLYLQTDWMCIDAFKLLKQIQSEIGE